jgi:hypothetical protein
VQIMNPNEGRAIVEDDGNTLRITIPATKNIVVICFLAVWLAGWTMGETSVVTELLTDSTPAAAKAFMIFWLCGWTLGGSAVALFLLWQLFGREVVELDSQSLRTRLEIFGIGRTKQFSTAHISNMRYDLPSTNSGRQANIPIRPKTIKFDFGKSTHGLGMGLDEAEAKQLIATMTNKVRSLQAA